MQAKSGAFSLSTVKHESPSWRTSSPVRPRGLLGSCGVIPTVDKAAQTPQACALLLCIVVGHNMSGLSGLNLELQVPLSSPFKVPAAQKPVISSVAQKPLKK